MTNLYKEKTVKDDSVLKDRFSHKLLADLEHYIEKKTGQKPDKRLTEDVATALSEMGKLFINNAELLSNDS